MRKTSWDALKAFAIELVRKKTKAEQKKSELSLKDFVVQLAIFTALVVSYVFPVFSFLARWVQELFDQSCDWIPNKVIANRTIVGVTNCAR